MEEIEKCKKEKEEILNSFKRERANFLNYKKEEKERVEKTMNYFLEEILSGILPILDNFEIAEKEAPSKDSQWIEGFLKIKMQIKDFLNSWGVKEIECVGKEFDPNFHEAVEVIEEGEPQKVKEEVQKGYTFKDKVIRPAKVKISK